jgi:integrase
LKRAARIQEGSVVYNRRYRTWNFLWCENGHRRSKLIPGKYGTKTAAWRAAEPFRRKLLERQLINNQIGGKPPLVKDVVERYRRERFPCRFSTARGYNCWLNNHILPEWGDKPVTELQPRPVELWLQRLNLSPKSKGHVKALLRVLVEFAMWCGLVEVARNPMELVVVKGASTRVREPRSLTVEEFHQVIEHLAEPFTTMARFALCFGLRASELLGLKWKDVDWLNGKLRIERGIVKRHVDDVKTTSSRKSMAIAPELLQILQRLRQASQFSSEDNWIFASPVKHGRLPISYEWFWYELQRACKAAGIDPFGVHSFRHTYRSWLDAVGTPIAVQQKMMRHQDIRTTMNIYGDVVTDEMEQAHAKVVRLALPRAN